MNALKKVWKWLRGLLCWRRKAGRVVLESETGLAGYELVVDGIDMKDWEVVQAGPSQWNRYAGGDPVLGEDGSVRLRCEADGDGYRCAGIKSKEAYGDGRLELEVSFRCGHGTWPAVWMSHPGGSRDNFASYYEVDLSEYYETRETTDTTYHCPVSMREGKGYYTKGKTAFVKYGWNRLVCEWNSEKIAVWVNGVEALRIENEGDAGVFPVDAGDRTMQVILSMQAGNRWLSPVDLGELPLWMDVRNFKLWRKV